MSEHNYARLFDKVTAHKEIFKASVMVEHGKAGSVYQGEYNQTLDDTFLIASITKLFTTACIFQLVDQEKITLDDHIHLYIDDTTLLKLHTIKGKDYSHMITIRHLLMQTSGLPDYYLGGEAPFFKRVKETDFEYNFNDLISVTKTMTAKFEPSFNKKAYYADINFDLLGFIIETIMNKPLNKVYEAFIIKPLKLEKTCLPPNDEEVPHTYLKRKKLYRPKFIKSAHASGGVVSTTKELMIFLKAFWQGKLFNKKHLDDSLTHPLQLSFYPIHYGLGFMKMTAAMPFKPKVDLVGHSGSTGSFAFYAKEIDYYFVGDLSQVNTPAKPVRLVMKLAIEAKR